MIEWIQGMDYNLLSWIIINLRETWLTPIMTFITSLGNVGAVWIVLSLILLIRPKTRKCGIAMLTALLLGLLVGNVMLKNIIARPRPFAAYPDIMPLVMPIDPFSFPSGHTLSSFCAASACFAYHKKAGAVCAVLALLIGFSRLYVGVHYPTDVLGGIVIGIILGFLSAYLVNKVCDSVRFRRIRSEL